MKKARVTRSMLPRQIKFTPEGFQKIKADIAVLELKRKAALVALQTAREMGDLSENGAYKAARFQLSDIDRELRRLRFQLRFGEVVEIVKNGTISFGSQVTLENQAGQLTFMLVDGYESDPKQQKISMHSPLGSAVLGKRVGEQVTLNAPAGVKTYTIVSVG